MSRKSSENLSHFITLFFVAPYLFLPTFVSISHNKRVCAECPRMKKKLFPIEWTENLKKFFWQENKIISNQVLQNKLIKSLISFASGMFGKWKMERKRSIRLLIKFEHSVFLLLLFKFNYSIFIDQPISLHRPRYVWPFCR